MAAKVGLERWLARDKGTDDGIEDVDGVGSGRGAYGGVRRRAGQFGR
jgi:hypothetical protein